MKLTVSYNMLIVYNYFCTQGTDELTCRRAGLGLYDEQLDPHVLQYVLHTGFYGEHRLGPIHLDHALITAFIEYWRPETHTFHLPVREASIML